LELVAGVNFEPLWVWFTDIVYPMAGAVIAG